MDIKALGLNIKMERYRKGYSQAYLAELSDLSPTSLSGIETGQQIPSAINLYLIAKALGVSIDELFKGIE